MGADAVSQERGGIYSVVLLIGKPLRTFPEALGGDACLNRGRGWIPLKLTGSRSRVLWSDADGGSNPPHENDKLTIGGEWGQTGCAGQ